MRIGIEGHDAAPTHREDVCSRESQALLPARRDRIHNVLFQLALRVREARRGREQSARHDADDVESERQSDGVKPRSLQNQKVYVRP